MFYENGFQKTRVSDIVREAKVAQGTFYLYFKSKDDIFLHICTGFKNRFATLIQGAGDLFSITSHEEEEQNLFVFIRDLIRLYAANKKLARIIFYESANYGSSAREMGENIYMDFIDMIRRRLEQQRDSGHISFEDAETEAAFLVGLFCRSLFYFIEMKNDIDIETLSRRMTLFILGGLRKNAGGLPPGL
jgi:AcrR family transcriptional regulator